MSLTVISDIWDELKHFIPVTDRAEAADSVVMALIDHDYLIEDIREEFRHDKDIKEAIASHTDDDVEVDEEEEWDDEEEEEDY